MPLPVEAAFPAGGTYALPVTLSGTSTPGSTIIARDDAGQDAGSATADDNGVWTLTPAPGDVDAPIRYRLTQQVDGVEAGESIESPEYVFAAPHAPGLEGATLTAKRTVLGVGYVELPIEPSLQREFSLFVHGHWIDRPPRAPGNPLRVPVLTAMGEQTIQLAYRDPVTGQRGASRSVTFTVVER